MQLPNHKTKLICTVGPASDNVETLAAMLRAGMSVARLNFSHGDFSAHAASIGRLREAAGLGTYGDSFIGHYLVPVIYPPGLTPAIQYLLAAIVVVVNGAVYALVWKRRR